MSKWKTTLFPNKISDWDKLGTDGSSRLTSGLLAQPMNGVTWDQAYRMWSDLINNHPELAKQNIYYRIIEWFDTYKIKFKRLSPENQASWFNASKWPGLSDTQYVNLLRIWSTEQLLLDCKWDKWHIINTHSQLNPDKFKNTIDDILDNHKIYGYRRELYDYSSFINFATSDIPPPSNIWNILKKATSSILTLDYVNKNEKLKSFIVKPDLSLPDTITLSAYAQLLEHLNISFWSVPLNGIYKNTLVSNINHILDKSEKLDVPIKTVLDFFNNDITMCNSQYQNNFPWNENDLDAINNIFKRAQATLSFEERLAYLPLYSDFIKQLGYSKKEKELYPWLKTIEWLPECKEQILSLKSLAFITVGPYIEKLNERHDNTIFYIEKFNEHVRLMAHGLTSNINPAELLHIPDNLLNID